MCVCLSASLCASHIFIIHLSASGCLTYFHVLVIINNATVNMGMQLSLQYGDFIFFRYTTKRGNDGSYSNSIFNFLGNFHTVFHNGCTILRSQKPGTVVPFSPHPCQHLLPFVFLTYEFFCSVIVFFNSKMSIWGRVY